MKKTVFCTLTALSLALSLTACGGQTTQTPPPADPTPSGSSPEVQPPTYDSYVFQVASADNYAVSIDQDMSEVLSALGQAQSYFEAASCAFEGLDKTYTYSGFIITTRPDGDKDYVNSILLTDDSVTTPEGIYIGSSDADVRAAYGEDAGTLSGALCYTKGGTDLNFILEDGKVISIEYLAT